MSAKRNAHSTAIPDREALAREFWLEVRHELTSKHHKSSDQADRGIGFFRWELDKHGAIETAYNRGVAETVDTVNKMIDNGLAAPA